MKKLIDLFNLKNRVAIITGGLGHLGLAMTEALLELNAKVIITGIREEMKQKESQRKLKYLKQKFPQNIILFKVLDFREDDSIREFFEEVKRSFKSVDILINNAAYGVSKPVEKISFTEFNSGLDGTLSSVFKCCQSVFPLMKMKKKGVIINIASMYGIVAPDWRIYKNSPSQNQPVNYGVSKAGVIQLTRYLASYWAKYGIRVNSISPGPFAKREVFKYKKFYESLKRKTMMNRIGYPEDLKGIIAILSTDASSYITGQNFIIDGGWTVW